MWVRFSHYNKYIQIKYDNSRIILTNKYTNNMSKVIERNVAEIIVLTLFILIMSSCQTVREMSGNDRVNNLRCTHVSR